MNHEEISTIVEAFKIGLVSLSIYLISLDYEMLVLWTIVAGIDVIVGTIGAMRGGEYTSRRMARGMKDKILEFFLLLAVVFAQRAAQKIGYDLPAASTVFGAFIFKDLGSILENLIDNGIELPKKVTDWFKVAKELEEEDKEEEKGD